jgi:hypothetical protein
MIWNEKLFGLAFSNTFAEKSAEIAQDIAFEVVDNRGCSGSACFYKKTGVECIVCITQKKQKNDRN